MREGVYRDSGITRKPWGNPCCRRAKKATQKHCEIAPGLTICGRGRKKNRSAFTEHPLIDKAEVSELEYVFANAHLLFDV